VPNTKGRLISSSEDIARLFTVSYTDYSLILRRPSTCLSAYFWMHIAGQRITEGRARALFRQALELVGQNEPRDREQLKSTCAPEKLPAALSKLWPRELPRCCCTNLRASVRWKLAKLLGLNAEAAASVLLRVYAQLWHLQPLSLCKAATLPCKQDNRLAGTLATDSP